MKYLGLHVTPIASSRTISKFLLTLKPPPIGKSAEHFRWNLSLISRAEHICQLLSDPQVFQPMIMNLIHCPAAAGGHGSAAFPPYMLQGGAILRIQVGIGGGFWWSDPLGVRVGLISSGKPLEGQIYLLKPCCCIARPGGGSSFPKSPTIKMGSLPQTEVNHQARANSKGEA